MQYCVDHPEEVSKLAKVKAQVSEVKGVMMENIEKVCIIGPILHWEDIFTDHECGLLNFGGNLCRFWIVERRLSFWWTKPRIFALRSVNRSVLFFLVLKYLLVGYLIGCVYSKLRILFVFWSNYNKMGVIPQKVCLLYQH